MDFGHYSQDPRTREPWPGTVQVRSIGRSRGGHGSWPPKALKVLFAPKREVFNKKHYCIFFVLFWQIFKIKGPNFKEKLEFGGRLGWQPDQLSPPPTNRLDPPMCIVQGQIASTTWRLGGGGRAPALVKIFAIFNVILVILKIKWLKSEQKITFGLGWFWGSKTLLPNFKLLPGRVSARIHNTTLLLQLFESISCVNTCEKTMQRTHELSNRQIINKKAFHNN